MRPIQNAGGEETIRERSYPVAKATAITAGQVVQLSGGKVVPAAAAQTAAILGIAGEDHSGTADILNPRADGDEILVCDNPGLIFECPVPTIKAASGSAATLVPASGDIAAGRGGRRLQRRGARTQKQGRGSSNSDKPGTRRAVTDYAKSGTVLTPWKPAAHPPPGTSMSSTPRSAAPCARSTPRLRRSL